MASNDGNPDSEGEDERQEPKLRAPLMAALRSGDLHEIRQLLSSGADLNSPGRMILLSRLHSQVPSNPLIWAVDVGKPEVVRLLLDNGADPNICCEYVDGSQACWLRPLLHASHPDIVSMLLDAGAEVNARHRPLYGTQTALLQASYFHWEFQSSVAELLIRRGADVNITDDAGCTALYRAILSEHYELATRLVQAGAEVDLCPPTGMTPLMLALHQGAPNSLIRSLLQSGADPHHSDKEGNTILYFALMAKNVCVLKWLVAENVDLETLLKETIPVQYVLDFCERSLTARLYRDTTHALDSLRALQVLALAGTNHVGNSFVIKQTQVQLAERLNMILLSAPRCRMGEVLQEICDIVHALTDMLSNPLSLSHLCRVQIRGSLGRNFRRKLHQLNVPLPIKEYLMIYKPVSIAKRDHCTDDGPRLKDTEHTDPVTAAASRLRETLGPFY